VCRICPGREKTIPLEGNDLRKAEEEQQVEGERVVAEENCALCNHPDRKHIEDGLATGELRRKAVAEDLDMSMQEMHDHMMHHFTRFGVRDEKGDVIGDQAHVPNEIRKLYNKKDILFNLMVDLKERLDLYFAKDEFDPSETTEIVRMVDAVRKLIDSLHTLEKDLKSENDLVLKNYEDLKMIILSKLCGPCRGAVMEALEKAEENNEKKVIAEIKDDGSIPMPQWK